MTIKTNSIEKNWQHHVQYGKTAEKFLEHSEEIQQSADLPRTQFIILVLSIETDQREAEVDRGE